MNGIAIIKFNFIHKRIVQFSGCTFVYDSPSVTIALISLIFQSKFS